MYRCITKIVWKSFYAREWWCFFHYLHWRLIQFPFAVYINLYLAPLVLLLISIILSIQNNPIMALFPDATSRGHNKGQNSTKKTINFIMLQKHIQWKFFRRWRIKGSKVRSSIYHIFFGIPNPPRALFTKSLFYWIKWRYFWNGLSDG